MGILNYLPEFKIVEANRLTGLVTGHVLAQFPLNPAAAIIKKVGGNDFVENGFIVGLGKDLQIDAYDPAKHAAPFLVFTEELNTFMDGLKYFATEEDADGDIYPRAIGLFVGDVFTTNNYAVAGAAAPKYAKVVAGKLTLQDVADTATMFVVEESTTPLGEEAYKFIYFGLTAAVFAAAAAAVTSTAIDTAVNATIAAAVEDGGVIDTAVDATIAAAVEDGGVIDTAVDATIAAAVEDGGVIDTAVDATIAAAVEDGGVIDTAVDATIAAAVEDGGVIDTAVDATIAAAVEDGGVIDTAVDATIAAAVEDGGVIDNAIDTVVGAAVSDHAALTTGVHGLE